MGTITTLSDIGTPWAETYRGSGRLTGRLAADPVYTNLGDVAPGWVYVGDYTEEEFEKDFSEGQHDQCHDSGHPDWSCPFCQLESWLD